MCERLSLMVLAQVLYEIQLDIGRGSRHLRAWLRLEGFLAKQLMAASWCWLLLCCPKSPPELLLLDCFSVLCCEVGWSQTEWTV